MKRLFVTILILFLFLVACAPAQESSLSPNPTPMVSEQAEVQSEPMLVEEIQPTITKKPKGKNPPVVATSTNPDFIATEITGRPTDRSITVNIVPATRMEIYYEYGTSSGVYTSQTPLQTALANLPLETLIDGLQANTRYYYRVNYKEISGVAGSFVTQRAPGSTFTFAIQGDSHPERVKKQFDPDLYTRTLLSAAADQPDFYLTIGDDFSVDILKTVNTETVRALYINQRQYLGLVGAPVFLVNGNHEQASQANLDGTTENVAVWAQNARNAYYPQPVPDDFYTGDSELVEHIGLLRNYYAFTWGDALFVILDPYWHSLVSVDNTFGSTAQDKKKRDLWEITLGMLNTSGLSRLSNPVLRNINLYLSIM